MHQYANHRVPTTRTVEIDPVLWACHAKGNTRVFLVDSWLGCEGLHVRCLPRLVLDLQWTFTLALASSRGERAEGADGAEDADRLLLAFVVPVSWHQAWRIRFSNPCSYFCIEHEVEFWWRELIGLFISFILDMIDISAT